MFKRGLIRVAGTSLALLTLASGLLATPTVAMADQAASAAIGVSASERTTIDFFEWMGVPRDNLTSVINQYESQVGDVVHEDRSDDGLSFENYLIALSQIDAMNEYRTSVGLSELRVNQNLMLAAALNADYSSTTVGHSPASFLIDEVAGECAAWNWSPWANFTTQWVAAEKQIFDTACTDAGLTAPAPKDAVNFYNANQSAIDAKLKGVIGHYLAVVSPTYNMVGIGLCTADRGSGYAVTAVADFGVGDSETINSSTFTTSEVSSAAIVWQAEIDTGIPMPDGSKPMFRLYNQYTGEHLYTADYNEVTATVEAGWTYEKVEWWAPSSSTSVPVYRLYNPYVAGGDHHYTTSEEEYNKLKDHGWKQEGIAWYSDANQGVSLYRLYNPYAVTGTHHYTSNANEVKELKSLGWRDEGIGWYGMK